MKLCSQAGSDAAVPETLTARVRLWMRLELGDGRFQRETVDQMDDAHLLGGGHEMAGREHAAVRLDHAQQAFVMRDPAACLAPMIG